MFLPRAEKDADWISSCTNWFELQGLRMLRRNGPRLLKNYKLTNGIIDRDDYIVGEENRDNQYKEVIDLLQKEDHTTPLDLKFYPIIPTLYSWMVNTFAKRNTSVSFKAVDENTYNEMLEQKRSMIEQNLLQEAEIKLQANLQAQGIDLKSQEAQDALSPDKIKSLPEIEQFFKKDFKSIPEIWAGHQKEVDEERFNMHELEIMAFGDMLKTDREFWHFAMKEDDYCVELWNPVTTFYHKSPNVRYISEGNWVGKVDMISPADAIDKYGWNMTEEQLASLQQMFPVKAAIYPITGTQNDGSFYDGTKSHEWNTNRPSLGMRQYLSMRDYAGTYDILSWILGESEDFLDFGVNALLRETIVYWKAQRKVGHLTSIDLTGKVTQDVVDEDYKVTNPPIFDNSIFKVKNERTLQFGEYIEWIWINEVYGAIKIGRNMPSYITDTGDTEFQPIYLGINQNKPGPLKFQFKGDQTLYGCKLPVEGSVFSDRNTRSTSFVDKLKPWQISYNVYCNQIFDIAIDELGSVVLLDQNAIPQHSMNEDWGKGNYVNAYTAMKTFGILPEDHSLSNLGGGANNNNQTRVLDLEQSKRFMSRIQLAQFSKQQALETIGITPQMLGQQLTTDMSATGTDQAINGTQTEGYFTQHCDFLMPRVHQMRTDLAQFYNATKPSLKLQYTTSTDEKMYFEMTGTDLLLRDINVYATTKANYRALIEEMKKMVMSDNTMNMSFGDKWSVLQAQNMGQLATAVKGIEEKVAAEKQQEQQHQQDLQTQQEQAAQQQQQEQQQFDADQKDKDRNRDVVVAEIRAAGYGAGVDKNNNGENDYVDQLAQIEKTKQYDEATNLQREKLVINQGQHKDKINIAKDKIEAEKQKSANDVKIAKIDKLSKKKLEKKK